MGWMFGWDSRKELTEHLTKPWEHGGVKTEAVAKYFSGNNLWVVFEQSGENVPEPKRFIAVFLMRRNGHWGYKDVTESMGPCEVSCPLKFLDMVPDPGGYATSWRAKVRAYQARLNKLTDALKGQTESV